MTPHSNNELPISSKLLGFINKTRLPCDKIALVLYFLLQTKNKTMETKDVISLTKTYSTINRLIRKRSNACFFCKKMIFFKKI